MRDISTMIRNAVQSAARREGRAAARKADREPLDLSRLVYPVPEAASGEKASAIEDRVLASGPASGGGLAGARPGEEAPAAFADSEAGEVRDIIQEARRIRTAMGKAVPAAGIQGEGREGQRRPRIDIDRFTANTWPTTAGSAGAELSPGVLDGEMRAFFAARRTFSGRDVADFIRHLKDKGYRFRENSILESVDALAAEQRGRDAAALSADVRGFVDRCPWPAECDVSAYIEGKRREGVACAPSEIRRMILAEMARRY